MRPIVTEQNPLRYRLNKLLGTEAHVCLLRVLANEADGPLTASDVAERTGLTTRGTRKALERLLQTGFVLRVGGGRKHQYELRRSGKLMRVLLELFEAEKDQYDTMINSIKKRVEELIPFPHAVWIVEFPGEPESPLVLGVLHESRHLDDYVHQMRRRLNSVEQEFDLTIEVNGYTKADLPGYRIDEVILLNGVMPLPDRENQEMHAEPLTHEERDRRLMELSRRIAEAIEHDVSLVRRAKEHVNSILLEDQGPSARDISEWRDILESYSIRRLSQFLISTSERANRLRQSNPIFAILSPDERKRILCGLGGDE